MKTVIFIHYIKSLTPMPFRWPIGNKRSPQRFRRAYCSIGELMFMLLHAVTQPRPLMLEHTNRAPKGDRSEGVYEKIPNSIILPIVSSTCL